MCSRGGIQFWERAGDQQRFVSITDLPSVGASKELCWLKAGNKHTLRTKAHVPSRTEIPMVCAQHQGKDVLPAPNQPNICK